ncbi:MAG: hypothetical protein HFG05_12590 [Oscillibacter sp.]|nr:hypothetical protein [Oscillibacter sp.]
MSDFRVMPSALRIQRKELETTYHAFCQDISELGGIIRRLGALSSFDSPIENLRRVQRRGSGQQVKLRQSANILGSVAELYIRTELRNLDDEISQDESAFRAIIPDDHLGVNWNPQEMVPDAGTFFRVKVIMPEND